MEATMLITLEEGRVVVLLVCPVCQRSVHVPHPESCTKECEGCGERAHVPDADETQPT